MIYSRDTSQDAERVQIAILREMSVARRIELLGGMNDMARQLALTGLRARHPGANAEELEYHFCQLTLGAALAEQVLAARRSRGIRPGVGMPSGRPAEVIVTVARILEQLPHLRVADLLAMAREEATKG